MVKRHRDIVLAGVNLFCEYTQGGNNFMRLQSIDFFFIRNIRLAGIIGPIAETLQRFIESRRKIFQHLILLTCL